MTLLILVVDDEPDVAVLFRQQFRRDLRTGRFTMEFAQSGDMALQRITDAAGVSLILILSDINMPGMTGLELLPKAKAVRPDVPVIMITAYGDVETKRKALEDGAEALFTKPLISECFATRSTHASRLPRDYCLVCHKIDITERPANVRFRPGLPGGTHKRHPTAIGGKVDIAVTCGDITLPVSGTGQTGRRYLRIVGLLPRDAHAKSPERSTHDRRPDG